MDDDLVCTVISTSPSKHKLFLSDIAAAYALVHAGQVQAVWSIGEELPAEVPTVFTPGDDLPHVPLVLSCVSWLPAWLLRLEDAGDTRERSIVIHCQAGQSRSCTALLAWAIPHQPGIPGGAWLAWLQHRHPDAAQNVGFMQQIRLWSLIAMLLRAAPKLGDTSMAAVASCWAHLNLLTPSSIQGRPELIWGWDAAARAPLPESHLHAVQRAVDEAWQAPAADPFSTVAPREPSRLAIHCAQCSARLAGLTACALPLPVLLGACAAAEGAWRVVRPAEDDAWPAAVASAAIAVLQRYLADQLQACRRGGTLGLHTPASVHWAGQSAAGAQAAWASRLQDLVTSAIHSTPPSQPSTGAASCPACGSVWARAVAGALPGHAGWASPALHTKPHKVEIKASTMH